jgi:hypothetical protein
MAISIRGYDSWLPDEEPGQALLIDGFDDFFANRFLAAHLLSQGVDEDLVFGAFETDERDLEDAYRQISKADFWPAYRVPLRGGGILSAIRRNFPEDTGVDYVLQAADDSEGIRIAAVEGSFVGPGISWPELLRVTWLGCAADPDARARQLLFMIAMLGDADAGTGAVAVVAEAFSVIGATGEVNALAQALVNENAMWELPRWTIDATGSLVCDGHYSPRNNNGKVALSAQALADITWTLAR